MDQQRIDVGMTAEAKMFGQEKAHTPASLTPTHHTTTQKPYADPLRLLASSSDVQVAVLSAVKVRSSNMATIP